MPSCQRIITNTGRPLVYENYVLISMPGMHRFFLISIFLLSASARLSGQNNRAELVKEVVNEFIEEYESAGYELVQREVCDKAPGELCRLPFQITPEISELFIIVIGSKKIKPTLALEDSETTRVITYTMEDDVSEEKRVNIVEKKFNLSATRLDVVFHFGNVRSFTVEDTYLLIFKKESQALGKQ